MQNCKQGLQNSKVKRGNVQSFPPAIESWFVNYLQNNRSRMKTHKILDGSSAPFLHVLFIFWCKRLTSVSNIGDHDNQFAVNICPVSLVPPICFCGLFTWNFCLLTGLLAVLDAPQTSHILQDNPYPRRPYGPFQVFFPKQMFEKAKLSKL